MGRVRKAGLPALMLTSLWVSPAGAQENVAALENPTPAGGITDVAGIRVGHFTYPDAHTGCTVVIADGGATGGVDVRGGAPGTAETDLLDPVNTVGNVGAGAGATVGKMRGMVMAMKGGLGTASITLESGLVVGAIVVVNAVGDVIDPGTGSIVAGARTEDGGFADARLILRGVVPRSRPRENTTIGVVATNARLTQAEATKVAQMAQDGLARAIVPAHTPGDGDTVFSLAMGTLEAGFNLGQVGALAAEAMADAIVRAVRAARGLPSLPAVRDLPGDTGPGAQPRDVPGARRPGNPGR